MMSEADHARADDVMIAWFTDNVAPIEALINGLKPSLVSATADAVRTVVPNATGVYVEVGVEMGDGGRPYLNPYLAGVLGDSVDGDGGGMEVDEDVMEELRDILDRPLRSYVRLANQSEGSFTLDF